MVQILKAAEVPFAILGKEEGCTGDPRGALVMSISSKSWRRPTLKFQQLRREEGTDDLSSPFYVPSSVSTRSSKVTLT